MAKTGRQKCIAQKMKGESGSQAQVRRAFAKAARECAKK